MAGQRSSDGEGGAGELFPDLCAEPGGGAERLPRSSTRPVKRSLTIAGHRTSISLEEPFWQALQQVAREKRKPLASLIFQIDAQRNKTNLSSAIRVYLLEHFRERAGKR